MRTWPQLAAQVGTPKVGLKYGLNKPRLGVMIVPHPNMHYKHGELGLLGFLCATSQMLTRQKNFQFKSASKLVIKDEKKLIPSHYKDSPFGWALTTFGYSQLLFLLGCVYHGAIKMGGPDQSLGLNNLLNSHGHTLRTSNIQGM